MLVFGDGVTTGIQQCVHMVVTKFRDGSTQKLMFVDAVSLQLFKGGANRSVKIILLYDSVFPM
jgi:hypothetical protein